MPMGFWERSHCNIPLTLFRNEDLALASQRDPFFAEREGREFSDRRGEFLLIKLLTPIGKSKRGQYPMHST